MALKIGENEWTYLKIWIKFTTQLVWQAFSTHHSSTPTHYGENIKDIKKVYEILSINWGRLLGVVISKNENWLSNTFAQTGENEYRIFDFREISGRLNKIL